MNRFLALITLIFCSLTHQNGWSQQITFESTSFDFGTVAEAGGNISHIFRFKNQGADPVVIISSQTSCGCTTPSYSRKPVAAGESGEVMITYDPMYRPGKFSKDVKLFTSASASPIILTIRGDVTEREKSIEEEFPYDMGEGVRIYYNHFTLGQVERGTKKEAMVSFVNSSDKSASIELRPTEQSGYLYNKAPKSIAAGEKGLFAIGYDMSDSKDYYGSMSDKLNVYINGKRSKYQLIASAHATDKFLLKDYNSSASANINKRFIKFAEIKHSTTSDKESFTIENIGVKPLNIRRVETAQGVKCSLEAGDKIAPGDIATAKVWVSTNGYDYGPFSSYVTLTVDDAERPIQRIRVTGIVIE